MKRITHIEITDLFGTAKASFTPGTFTLLSGSNGSGKSSICRALAIVFDGGKDPAWIRKGAKRGQVKITLDDGTTITKTVTPKTSTVEITDPKGLPIPAPQTFINSLGDSWAVDPGKLLAIDASKAAGRKTLIETLLQLMPLEFTAADVLAGAETVGAKIAAEYGREDSHTVAAYRNEVAEQIGLLPEGTMDLAGLDKARKGIEEVRRRAGVELRDQQGVIATLEKSLPPEAEGGDWGAKANALEGTLRALAQKEINDSRDITNAADVEHQAVRDEYEKKEQELRAEFDRLMSELRAERNGKLAEIKDAASNRIAEIIEANRPERDYLTAEIATAKERAAAQQRAEGVRIQLKQYFAKSEASQQRYDALSKTLEAIDAARKAKLDDLPVQGIEVTGDNVLVNGVEWHLVNTGKLAEIAIAICAKRAGELQFLIVDNAEHLDAQALAALKEAAIGAGFQVIAARVTSGKDGEWEPLAIEAEAA